MRPQPLDPRPFDPLPARPGALPGGRAGPPRPVRARGAAHAPAAGGAAGARRLAASSLCRLAESAAAGALGVPAAALRRARRGPAAEAAARGVAMYLAHVGGLALTDVGRAFGRDRTTARHACRRVEERRDDPALDRALDALEAGMRAHRAAWPAAGAPAAIPQAAIPQAAIPQAALPPAARARGRRHA